MLYYKQSGSGKTLTYLVDLITMGYGEFTTIITKVEPKTVFSLQRLSDVAYVVTTSNHGYETGDVIDIYDTTEDSENFNVTNVTITKVNDTKFSFEQEGDDFSVTEDSGVTLSASSETKDVKVSIEKDSDVIAEFNVREESSAMYSLSYLSEMTKAIKASELVMLAFSASMPIQLEFPIVAGGKLTYYCRGSVGGLR